MSKKAQVSIELLLVVGFILLLFIPLLFTLYLKMGDSIREFSILQSHFTVSRFHSLSKAVGYAGSNSAIITELYFPPYVESFTSAGNETTITLGLPEGSTEISKPLPFSVAQGFQYRQGRNTVEISNQNTTIFLNRCSRTHVDQQGIGCE